jgi:SAM-dependent methyltransferase
MDYKKYHRDKTYIENEGLFRNIFMTRFTVTKRYKQKPETVLDIGASNGVMLDIFKENGAETWGVEPSENAEIAKSKGHKIISEFFEKAKLPIDYFDLVIMNHTLEHLDNPKFILKKIYKILKKDGILLVDVPNAGGFGSRILGDKWPYRLPEEHKQQFTKKSLTKVFEDAKFEVIYFGSRSGIFEFYNPTREIWEAFITKKKRFFTDLINIPYDILVTFFNMGDSMTMVGRKL